MSELVGVRIRDPQTGALRLDTTDYTNSLYFHSVFDIPALSGSIPVPGVNPDDFGAFFLPDRIAGQSYSFSQTPEVACGNGVVTWQFRNNHFGVTLGRCTLIVVKYV